MQKAFWFLLVWLLGTAAAHAQPSATPLFTQPETLTYKVKYAGFNVGTAKGLV